MPELTGIFSNNPHLIDVFTSKHDTIIKNNTIAISSQDEGVGTYFSGIYNEGFWLAIGVGIKKESGHFKIMEKADWELAYKTGVIPENGHFIFIKYDNRKLEIANDPFGIRDLFYTWENDTILFSTKIESLVDYKEDAKINFNAISTDFLFSERFTYDSELKGISRLGPDARAVFYPDKLTLKRNDTFLNPLNENKNIDDYFNNILSISTSKPLSLGLSGGVDSRILLAYMLANGVNFTTHSFGSREDPDNIAAKEMANSLKFENKVFDEYDRYKIIDYLREFLNYNPFNRGIERVPYYYFYKKQGENNTIIDGAFGEFARRDYYKKLLYLDKISRLNPISIYKTLKTSVPPIFNDNILPDMEISAKEQIEKIYSSYKKYKYVLSIDDFVALKYHFPNKMGRDQARIDKYCISFMPFAQSELIRTLLFPKRKTVDENVIRYLYKPLSKFPFVKNGKLYPFNKKMRYLIKLREKLFKKQRQEPSENTILLSREVKNYIFDEISSIKFKNNNILNKKLIETSINEFYKGDYSKKSILSSFLSFYIPERINKLL